MTPLSKLLFVDVGSDYTESFVTDVNLAEDVLLLCQAARYYGSNTRFNLTAARIDENIFSLTVPASIADEFNLYLGERYVFEVLAIDDETKTRLMEGVLVFRPSVIQIPEEE